MNAAMAFLAANIVYVFIGVFVFVLVASRFRRHVDPVFALVGIVLLGGFLGYLIFEITQVNLIVVVVAVLAMAIYDFWVTSRGNGNGG